MGEGDVGCWIVPRPANGNPLQGRRASGIQAGPTAQDAAAREHQERRHGRDDLPQRLAPLHLHAQMGQPHHAGDRRRPGRAGAGDQRGGCDGRGHHRSSLLDWGEEI